MTVKYEPRVYAPLFGVPSYAEKLPDFYSYEHMRKDATRHFYMQVKVAETVATEIALKTPFPDGVKLAVMKQIANEKMITLRQLLILLSWAARRAQR